jgi:uncharacterized membrane protein HdeD (DUF308 family)
MLSLPLNPATKQSILIYLSVYGGLTAIIYLFKNRDARNYGFSVIRIIGATLGLVAGFCFGYQICALTGIFDGVSPIETSYITIAISFGCSVVGLQIGGVLSNNILSSVKN